MKKLVFILFILSFMTSCFEESEGDAIYSTSYRNDAPVPCIVKGFRGRFTPDFEIELAPGEASEPCEYRSDVYAGDFCLDSITFIFPINGKGYECNVRPNGINDEFCFSTTRTPLIALIGLEGFEDLGNRHFQFVITEEDFRNAKDLD